MDILNVYKKYQIMPQLQEHQLRVAAVGAFICDNFSITIDRENVITACLLHDMGNIVKFDLGKTKDLYRNEFSDADLVFWQSVKKNFLEHYGATSHDATMSIVKELGVSARVQELVSGVGFTRGATNAASSDFGRKICAYSDMRVKPNGVVGIEERMADLRVRYNNHPEGTNNREEFEAALRQIEQQIFAHCSITPEDITKNSVAKLKRELEQFKL